MYFCPPGFTTVRSWQIRMESAQQGFCQVKPGNFDVFQQYFTSVSPVKSG